TREQARNRVWTGTHARIASLIVWTRGAPCDFGKTGGAQLFVSSPWDSKRGPMGCLSATELQLGHHDRRRRSRSVPPNGDSKTVDYTATLQGPERAPMGSVMEPARRLARESPRSEFERGPGAAPYGSHTLGSRTSRGRGLGAQKEASDGAFAVFPV